MKPSNMSGNTPRKFSEKIAMMNRKQNEDQEQFRSVMNEVSAITNKTRSPGSSQGSPNAGTPTDPTVMMQMTSPYNIPNQPPPNNMLGPHPMTSSSMGWNRPGGSLPNVHQIAQNPMDAYNNWGGYWPGAPQMQQPHHPQQNQPHPQRTRSPGAQHYHPYRKSNERIPQNDSSSPTSVHLQPPDNSWSRARSDPTIHMNTVNPNNYYYNGQQWSPDMLTNGQHPVQHHQQQQQQQHHQQQQQNMYQQQQHQPQQQQQQPPHHPAMAPPAHMGYPAAQYSQPQSMVNYDTATMQQMHQPMNDMPIGSLPANPTYMMQSSSAASPPGPMSVGPYPNQQQLSTPAVVSESQSAPTSPAQNYETPRQPQWPPTRHYSASPDTMDIPNIVLTGADGTLDCFQGLHLDSDDMRQLMNDQHQLDPSLETQLLN